MPCSIDALLFRCTFAGAAKGCKVSVHAFEGIHVDEFPGTEGEPGVGRLFMSANGFAMANDVSSNDRSLGKDFIRSGFGLLSECFFINHDCIYAPQDPFFSPDLFGGTPFSALFFLVVALIFVVTNW